MSKKVLLVSVGGSPNPVIHSINTHQPTHLILFASKSSRTEAVENVLPRLSAPVADREFIVTPDEQDLEKCVSALMQRLPGILETWGAGYDALGVDFTGGTKVMSASVVLTLASRVSGFSYVGGVERDKQGLGVVIDGREMMLVRKNPWNELSVELLDDMALLFNRCRFQSAADLADQAGRRTPAKKELFDGLKAAAEGYYSWDNFHYEKAAAELRKAESKLRAVCNATTNDRLRAFHRDLAGNLTVLKKVVDEVDLLVKSSPKRSGDDASVDGSAIICDLLANAVRRGEVEYKYDDAVARLYSAIEKTAKIRLKVMFGIDNSDVSPEQIPEGDFKEQVLKECVNSRDEARIQLPLHKSFELLRLLGDGVGALYDDRKEELGRVLTTRNMSLLAHGFAPVSRDTYDRLLTIALLFLSIRKDTLPRFPAMDWGGAGI